jgi:hypothetical protein
MFASTPKVSPVLQTLIDKGLFDRLPVTFSTFFFDQIKDWDLLFPAEQSYYERLFSLIDKSDVAEVSKLFAPLIEAERKMGVNDKVWPKRTFTLEQVDLLNRSPHYPEWRKAAAGIFAVLDPLLDTEVARRGHSRLVVVLSPAELPVGPDRMWTRIAKFGRRIPIEAPQEIEDYLPLLVTGEPRARRSPSIADLCAKARPQDRYAAWSIESGEKLANVCQSSGVVRLSYDRFEQYRSRLMTEVQRALDTEQIRGPRQLGARLKQMKIRFNEGEAGKDPVLAEFARAVLLAGNGTLLLNNTFVEWATVQAVRRARPTASVISFGIRNKVKPFSSLLIYTDQETATPIPTQADVLGSYVDLEIFYQYVWQEYGKFAEYRGNTAFLFAGEGLDEMLIIGPADFPLLKATKPVRLASVFQQTKEWMSV